ncbi:TetR family transcriptional regulator [Mycolicibacterium conceptionense]|uniref:TetR family transcriptional regulator n=1 Tax=Mycolicibacterium conceptionense TaxID=451644 RepID=A0A0U1DUX5_9MYCO|nr:TetR family transcriptional regulator [Mycolicibacterium conceptionense]
MARTANPPLTGAWHHDLAGGLRKRPLQERSKSMIQRILDTAAELVEEVGYEAVVGSPTLLLDRCGVSRGSFYAFFESPERVLDELCYQASGCPLRTSMPRCGTAPANTGWKSSTCCSTSTPPSTGRR